MTENARENFIIATVSAVIGAIVGAVLATYLPPMSLPKLGAPTKSAAGCMIAYRGELVGVLEDEGFALPGGTWKEDEDGFDANGNPNTALSAARETEEETGLVVDVGRVIRTFEEGDTRFTLYECSINPQFLAEKRADVLSGESDPLFPLPIRPEEKGTILSVVLVNPYLVPARVWRFGEKRKDDIQSIFKDRAKVPPS